MAETLYQKRQAAKRSTRDIERLKQDFSRKLEEYNVQSGTKLAEYEKKVGEYDASYGSYESRFNEYQQAANEFNARVLAYQGRVGEYNKALEKYMTKTPITGEYVSQLYSKDYLFFSSNTPQGVDIRYAVDLPKSGSTGFYLKEGYDYEPTSFQTGGSTGFVYKREGADPGEFTEKFEEKFTMEAPVAPAEPEALDISAEKAKLEEERNIMEREIGERTKARTRAVQRGQQRPMLSSGTTLKPKA